MLGFISEQTGAMTREPLEEASALYAQTDITGDTVMFQKKPFVC
jgi:hypothetical protein